MTRLLGAILVLLAAVGSATGQNVPRDGTEILRGLLKYNGFKPVRTIGGAGGGTLVVLVGSRVPPNIFADLEDMLGNGGSLLIVTDEPMELKSLLPRVRGVDRNAVVANVRVRCSNPANCFGGDPRAPLLQLQAGDPTQVGKAQAIARQGGLMLATRNPRAVWNQQAFQDSVLSVEVAKFAAGAHYAPNENDDASTAVLAAMTDPDQAYTAMVYADRAMFTNGLMTAKDAQGRRPDNFAYTFLVTRYLAGRVNGDTGRKECVFIEDGQLVTDFDAVSFTERKLPPGAIPPIPPVVLAELLLEKGNDFVAQVEDRDFPNVLQERDRRNSIQDLWLLTVAVVGSIVLGRYLLARGWGQRQASDLAPRVRIDPDRGGGLIPERRLGLLQSGNLYEPLRDHLRFVFGQWGVTAFDRAELPPVALDRKTRPRTRIMTDLYRLWEIAAGPQRTTITPDDMEDLEEMIADLASAHQKGIWRFAPSGGTA